MITIENSEFACGFITKGAEWRSFKAKKANLEFLWQADPAFWGKAAPVLFPIVGSLKGGAYQAGGQSYQLGRHGFARDLEFAVASQTATEVRFRLVPTADTATRYPFDWVFEVAYRLEDPSLITTFLVKNPGATPLYFSVGAHPAFRIPLLDGERFEDYVVEFDKDESAEHWYLDKDGLVTNRRESLPIKGRQMPLSRPLLANDALVIKGLKSTTISLYKPGSACRITMDCPDFPFFGIWSAPNAPFLCLEPWCGVSDSVDASGKIEGKEGIVQLAAGGVFERSFTVSATA